MRIAQVSPLYESVPPLFYGGPERIVSYLTEALLQMGHDVTLFASGDSDTAARLIPCCRNALRLDKTCIDPLAHHILMLEQVYRLADRFDVIHFHIDYLSFPLARRYALPTVSTLHGRLDLPDLVPLYREFTDIPVVSISRSQRKPLSWANWQGTVYHGMPADILPFQPNAGSYLAFLGRVSPEKGVDVAIEVARRSGIKLKMAAKVDPSDRNYFETAIRPLLDPAIVEYVGEISDEEKPAFLGNALALIFPINWEEPFGLVMIEAMACGTPVIATRRGSVPEILTDGISGYIVDDIEGAVEAVKRVHLIDRESCRQEFEERFLSERMAAEYLAVYRAVAGACDGQKEDLSIVHRTPSRGVQRAIDA